MTLNVALDVTYETPVVEWGGSNRVGAVRRRAGGKGVNVARVAAALGREVVATGLIGGDTGELIRADLDAAGLRHSFHGVRAESRRTVTVVEEHGAATVFNEGGPEVAAGEWAGFLAHFRSLLPATSVVVLSGSMPPGVPPDAYAVLAEASDMPVILDADGAALGLGVAGRPTLVKPNAEELARATGEPSPVEGALALRAQGAGAVLVSLGHEGMLAITPDGNWRAVPPGLETGNPTGAGDAAVAAVASGLADRASWPELLRHAVALSAAAVRAPVAGDFDGPAYARLLSEIVVHPL
ncbi:1-phosphofructokinase family hexose kinase [Actinomadura barringtoniae]|uniref:1-phosphofructokinase family hexose kinase n=1 Tax=Actinomadura barringtoniae TaxID=1427535 RepID=UPI0027DD9A30|nr:1-phosphofructokinase family hexose kinase [Actinomadura barringtoniae]